MSIGTLLVGLGRIGMGYDLNDADGAQVCTHARAFMQHEAFTLLGGVDEAKPSRRTFEQVYGLPTFSDVDAAVERLAPQLVVVALPTALHAAAVDRILRHSNVTAICCEKPLAADVDEGRAMVRACLDRGVALFVNYIRRSDPGVIEIKRRIDAGEIASPIKGVAWYSKGLLHNGSHLVNLLELWLGELENSRVVAAGRRWDGHDPEPDLHLTFRGGTMAIISASEECFTHLTVELVACNGRLRYDNGGRRIEWQPTQADPQFSGYTTLGPAETIPSGLTRYQWHVTDQLARALTGQQASICTGAEALRTLEHLQVSTAGL